MADRFERIFQLPQNLYSAGSPVIVVAGVLLKDTHSNKILVQLKFKNISSHNVKAVKVRIAACDAIGERINEIKEYQYLDLNVSTGDVFGANKAIIMPKVETRSFSLESLWVVLDDDSVQNVIMPLAALPEGKRLDEVLKHPELLNQFIIEVNEKATYAPQEIGDIWRCSCSSWNRTEKCPECNIDKYSLFLIYDPVTLVEHTKVRLRKEKAEREAQEEQARKDAEEKAKQLETNTAIQKTDAEYIFCEQCGSQIKYGVNFCRYCGVRITRPCKSETVRSEQITIQSINQNTERKRMKKSRTNRFVLVTVIIAILLAVFYGTFALTIKYLENNGSTKQENVKQETTNTVQPQATKPKSSTASKPQISTPTEPKENIEHMVSFMKGYNYMTHDFNIAAETNYPLITLDDIRNGHFKTSTWGSFDVYMSDENEIEKVVYCAMMDDLLDDEENFYEMACNVAAIMHGMDNKLTEDQRKDYTGGILSYDYTNGSVYSRTYNGVTYEMDIAYGMSFRLVAARK